MSLPIIYEYCGQYDHAIRIEIDEQGVLTRIQGNYQTQSPVRKQLKMSSIKAVQTALQELNQNSDRHNRTRISGFDASIRFGKAGAVRLIHWQGPAQDQSPAVHALVELLHSL